MNKQNAWGLPATTLSLISIHVSVVKKYSKNVHACMYTKHSPAVFVSVQEDDTGKNLNVLLFNTCINIKLYMYINKVHQ